MFSNVGKQCFKLWCVLCAVQFVTELRSVMLSPQNCNFSKVRHRLPDDGPHGPKHVRAIMRYFVIKGCICW